MVAGCAMSAKLKSIKGASLFGRFFLRRARPTTNSTDEEKECQLKFNIKLYQKFIHRHFKEVCARSYTFTLSRSSEIEKEKVDFSELLSKSVNQASLIMYNNMKEDYKNSIRKIMISSNPVTRVQEYILTKANQEFGVDKYGLYIIDSDLEKNTDKTKLHKNTVIDKLLDYDYIDTENTDYTYLREEESISEEANLSQMDISDVASISDTENDFCASLTFNGKKISMYETEVLTESITAPDST